MFGLSFQDQAQPVISHPGRTDIACFIGFVGRRDTRLPAEIARWLHERNWLETPAAASDLRHLPTPIDTWETFDHLFTWEQRPLAAGGPSMPTYLGAAVRAYFTQGGRKCYVVRVDDPWPYMEATGDRTARIVQRLNALLPGYSAGLIEVSPVDPASWRGIGHLLGLTDVSFVCLPDLPDIVRSPEVQIDPLVTLPPQEERFVECSDPQPAPPVDPVSRRVQAPQCDEVGYIAWTDAIGAIAQFLYRRQKEVQLVAALPLAETGGVAELDLLAYLDTLPGQPLARSPKETASGMASAFVQLAYPWVRTSGSVDLPQGLAPPDGVLAGLLARSALSRGAFRSVAGQQPIDVQALLPELFRRQVDALGERVSVFALTPDGFQLFADVTTSLQSGYRQAHVNRLISAIVRAARQLGGDVLFEPSGEVLWSTVRDQMRDLLEGFRNAGALRGISSQEAYFVRCDRSTMSQNDIDNGRIVAEIQVDPASAIDGITVVLAIDEGGSVSLAEGR